MRSAPIGILSDIRQILEYSTIQAAVTHNTEEGVLSAQAIAMCSHFFLYKLGSKADVCQFVSEATKYNWSCDWKGPVPCSAIGTVEAMLTILTNCGNLSSILVNSVSFTGDVDTVSAVSCGIASQTKLYENDLPSFLYEELENDTYGKEYLISVGTDLLAKIKS